MQRIIYSFIHVRSAVTSVLFGMILLIGGLLFNESEAQSVGYKSKIISNIAYTKATDSKSAGRQTLDLHLPVGMNSKPPLVIFVHGGYWAISDEKTRIGKSIAVELVTRGVAVALVRYRLAPDYKHPTQAKDVAAGVAHLIREADKYGVDKKRIFLAGHSSGAHLAALIALDSSYLTAQGISPKSLAGIVAISGSYDLSRKTGIYESQKKAIDQAFGNNPAMLKSASPITHAHKDTPSFLILTASGDFPELLQDARKFTTALRGAGHQKVEQYIIPDRDHYSMMQLKGKDNEVRGLLLAFLKVQPLTGELAELLEAKRGWITPPLSNLPFWRHKGLIRSHPIEKRFVESLLPVYGPNRYELLEWPLERFYSIDLFTYLDSFPQKFGRGDYLIITNLRHEKQFWTREEIEPYKPVIVIGIDDEKNLFRFSVFYRAFREYSWKYGPRPPMMARPLGAFIYFLNKPPPKWNPMSQYYALTTKSFQLVDKDPLETFRDLPKEAFEVLTHRNGCLYCHTFLGIGARGHHITASTGAGHGGFALPLEEYPPEVWKAFIFNQKEVAAKIGSSTNMIDETLRQPIHDLIVRFRQQRPTQTR